jgi:hypothetical protein
MDCAPLSCHEPWFATHAFDDDTNDGPGIVVILPDAVVCQAVLAYRGEFVKAVSAIVAAAEEAAIRSDIEATGAGMMAAGCVGSDLGGSPRS